jgi:hypothetical protein
MSELTTALLEMQRAINATIREEVRDARREFKEGLEQLEERQAEDRAAQAVDRAAIAALQSTVATLNERTKMTSRGLLSALTGKQKTALGTFVVGILVDGALRIFVFISAWLGSGVRP